MSEKTWNVAVVGLGYVGLPLAIEFGKQFPTIGYDVSEAKVAGYRDGRDPMGEVSGEEFAASRHIEFTTDSGALARADLIVVAVPTPIDEARRPDLQPLVLASRAIGPNLKPGAIVCYESTVYPGATEEVCVPVLERHSGKRWKQDFFVGYSPERINPGDKQHTLARVTKVVAGDTPRTLDVLAEIYGAIVPAGIHRTTSIRVAEAAKVIENTQRDLNIALMNELAIIFQRLGLDTLEVLEAAGTKWNFLPFRPGLVGGHCIGVDPYYLTYKAEMTGYHPQVILAGRRINDGMGKYIAEQAVKQMIAAGGSAIKGAKVNVLGLTFKEDVPDLRNSRAVDVIHELQTYGVEVAVHDPIAAAEEAHEEYGIALTDWDALPVADALVVAVAHADYLRRPARDYVAMLRRGGCFVDVKARFDRPLLERAGVRVWRL
jgi:UDP-N-acetyl-D-glucosamine/UDP-N-acetyl-D-galactosamine dehydrogenase